MPEITEVIIKKFCGNFQQGIERNENHTRQKKAQKKKKKRGSTCMNVFLNIEFLLLQTCRGIERLFQTLVSNNTNAVFYMYFPIFPFLLLQSWIFLF